MHRSVFRSFDESSLSEIERRLIKQTKIVSSFQGSTSWTNNLSQFNISLCSQIIGYAIVGITFSLQPVMRWACEKLEGFWRIIVADIFLFVSFVGTVNGKIQSLALLMKQNLFVLFSFTVWRGIWALLDCYFLPSSFVELSQARHLIKQPFISSNR